MGISTILTQIVTFLKQISTVASHFFAYKHGRLSEREKQYVQHNALKAKLNRIETRNRTSNNSRNDYLERMRQGRL